MEHVILRNVIKHVNRIKILKKGVIFFANKRNIIIEDDKTLLRRSLKWGAGLFPNLQIFTLMALKYIL